MPSGRKASEADFSEVRQRLVRVSSRFGSAGPGGASVASEHSRGSLSESGVPDFYIVDDQLSDYRRVFLEITPEALSSEWMTAIAAELRASDDWDALIRVGEAILIRVDATSISVFGLPSATLGLQDAVRAAQEHALAAETTRRLAATQRRTAVAALIPQAWAAGPADLACIGVFQNRSDGSDGVTVWLLHRLDQSAFDLDDYDFEPDAVRPALFWGFPTGRLVEYKPGSREEGGSLVAEWALVDRGRPVTHAGVLRVHKGRRVWTFDLLPQ